MERDEGVKVRNVTVDVKGIDITYDEYYRIDLETGEEIFDRDLEIKNDSIVFDIYKKQKGLLTNSEIKSIRKKYDMNQKEYAMAIGVGEVTVNRFENGSIQTEATDAIMRLSENPDNMYDLLLKNQPNIPEELFDRFMKKVNELKKLKEHRIATIDFDKIVNLNFETVDVDDVADNVIQKYNLRYIDLNKEYNIETNCEFITPLKLQKLLYYVQGLALSIFGKPAFNNKICAWNYGPVVNEIYQKYKINQRDPISTPKNIKKISEGLECLIKIVIASYGKFEAGSLIDLTHDEEPWLNTEKNEEISLELIKNYFDKVYEF